MAGNPWFDPGSPSGTAAVVAYNHWLRIRAQAELEDVRLHDLRRSFASRALALGESLRVIAKLLGHSQLKSAKGYAYLSGEPVKEAAARVPAAIGEDNLPEHFGSDRSAAAAEVARASFNAQTRPRQSSDFETLDFRSASKSDGDCRRESPH